MQLVLSILNLAGLGGVGIFIFLTVKSLRQRIDNLTLLANEQKETLEAVRERAAELDQMRKDYRECLQDFQDMGKKLDERRRELVVEMEAAIQRKDAQIAQAKKLELKELELKQESLSLVPELQERLGETIRELDKLIGSVTLPQSKARWLLSTHATSGYFQRSSESSLNFLPCEMLHGFSDVYLLNLPSTRKQEPDTADSEP